MSDSARSEAAAGSDGADSQTRILEAAKRMFLQEGYGVSIERIATAANVARQTIYNRFNDKDALFDAVVDDLYSRLERETIPLSADADLPTTLSMFGRLAIRMSTNPESIGLTRIHLGLSADRRDRRTPSLVLRARREVPVMSDQLVAYFERQVRQGSLPPLDPAMVTEAFIAAVAGHARQKALVGEMQDPPERTERYLAMVVDIFVAGLTGGGGKGATPNV